MIFYLIMGVDLLFQRELIGKINKSVYAIVLLISSAVSLQRLKRDLIDLTG